MGVETFFAFYFRCNMAVGGGATVLLRRGKFPGGFVDFNRGEKKPFFTLLLIYLYTGSKFDTDWETYVNGFGDPSGEYWLGLEAMHVLTTVLKRNTMRVDFTGNDGVTK